MMYFYYNKCVMCDVHFTFFIEYTRRVASLKLKEESSSPIFSQVYDQRVNSIIQDPFLLPIFVFRLCWVLNKTFIIKFINGVNGCFYQLIYIITSISNHQILWEFSYLRPSKFKRHWVTHLWHEADHCMAIIF